MDFSVIILALVVGLLVWGPISGNQWRKRGREYRSGYWLGVFLGLLAVVGNMVFLRWPNERPLIRGQRRKPDLQHTFAEYQAVLDAEQQSAH